ncbi:elongation factor P [Candidatus Peregrinibacteria bacterium CG22_combo_CG10-13_8_21_14_all_44_10]|nr:MAG: elongation factor P [Candidatus Peregrinibacteria bacterium CG2_30_44_17]PIP66665.1 MAG: elongation factor P [Candidatus Peregrinibacteria bacterium CG22_combo_CG10-13_8_21_14_all_44_10]PIS04129.1 MAG: elongation factor P [Candidatus Peregrinibacteria bacterium CG10_big_fil_rev_8_21_14_0_10_44_7]PIX80539.1 MAG: elongation factor P [Candidatus Peregrinibacteria bacterium CG_4_10_14_3_um_filter_44_21]PJB88510.1 MAG: elongation factor P [Candidatus Peregrinibacteria bacterium CG_4_9_14_0_8
MLSIAQLKPGVTIKMDGHPYVVLQATFSKQARGGGTNNTKLKNLISGSIIQKTFQGSDQLEQAEVGYSRAQYLYSTGGEYHFMDSNTFEQFAFTEDDLGDAVNYLLDGTDVDIQRYEDKPIGVRLPPKVDLKVIQADPGVKGDTASGGRKPAKLETGLTVQVPLFISEGDKIRVNTETGEYVERA